MDQRSKSRIRLQLRRDTVRDLTTPELGAAQGGVGTGTVTGTVTTVTTITTIHAGISVAFPCESHMGNCTVQTKTPGGAC